MASSSEEDLLHIMQWRETPEQRARQHERLDEQNILYCGDVYIEKVTESAKSLGSLCLATVNADTEKCMEASRQDDLYQGSLVFRQLDLIATLPWNLIETVFVIVLKTYKFHDQLAHFLGKVTGKLTKLNVFDCLVSFSYETYYSANPLHCKEYMTEKDLCLIFRSLPHLTVLDVSHCHKRQFTGDMCGLIGRSCPNLEDLNLSYNLNITDQTISKLWNGAGGTGCHKLRRLDVVRTKVTQEGLISVLENLKALECVQYKRLGDALKLLHTKRSAEDFQSQPLALRNMDLTLSGFFDFFDEPSFDDEYESDDYDDDDMLAEDIEPPYPEFDLNISFYPHLTELKCNVREKDFRMLASAKHLKKLTLVSQVEQYNELFAEEFIFLLQEVGESLTYLHLGGVPTTFAVICAHCPNMEELIFYLRCSGTHADAIFKQTPADTPTLEKLSILQVIGSFVDLTAVSECCPNLLELNADSGVRKALGASVEYLLEGSSHTPFLPKLQKLRLALVNLEEEFELYGGRSWQSGALAHLLHHSPHLEELELNGVLPDTHALLQKKFEFPYLKVLRLGGCKQRSKSESGLYCLLSNAPNIKVIDLCLMAVTDAAFHRLMVVNNLTLLRVVKVKSCAITTETPKILMLSTPEGKSRKVECETCHPIASCDQDAILQEEKVNGWRVARHYFDVDFRPWDDL